MILTSALAVLAAAALSAPAPEPTKTSVLPPDCGLTEEQVVKLAVPDYSLRIAQFEAHRGDEINEYWFEAKVVAVITTDFAFSGHTFLVAAVSVRSGFCDGCYDAVLVVIDRQTKKPVWRLASGSGTCYIDSGTFFETDEPILRVVRVFPADPVQTLAFRFGSEDPFHGGGATNEKWLRPSLATDGSLTFEAIWEATISFGTSGVASFTWPHEMTSTMTSLWPRRAYRFTTRTVAGWDDIALVAIQEFAQD
ncbi:MAG: hypothetical protein LAO05_14040 [Acidobacteriia bacterium]|nr:hypothetical protein [Terriglobia bacterium]